MELELLYKKIYVFARIASMSSENNVNLKTRITKILEHHKIKDINIHIPQVNIKKICNGNIKDQITKGINILGDKGKITTNFDPTLLELLNIEEPIVNKIVAMVNPNDKGSVIIDDVTYNVDSYKNKKLQFIRIVTEEGSYKDKYQIRYTDKRGHNKNVYLSKSNLKRKNIGIPNKQINVIQPTNINNGTKKWKLVGSSGNNQEPFRNSSSAVIEYYKNMITPNGESLPIKSNVLNSLKQIDDLLNLADQLNFSIITFHLDGSVLEIIKKKDGLEDCTICTSILIYVDNSNGYFYIKAEDGFELKKTISQITIDTKLNSLFEKKKSSKSTSTTGEQLVIPKKVASNNTTYNSALNNILNRSIDGFKRVNVSGDGSCFYHAVMRYLTETNQLDSVMDKLIIDKKYNNFKINNKYRYWGIILRDTCVKRTNELLSKLREIKEELVRTNYKNNGIIHQFMGLFSEYGVTGYTIQGYYNSTRGLSNSNIIKFFDQKIRDIEKDYLEQFKNFKLNGPAEWVEGYLMEFVAKTLNKCIMVYSTISGVKWETPGRNNFVILTPNECIFVGLFSGHYNALIPNDTLSSSGTSSG